MAAVVVARMQTMDNSRHRSTSSPGSAQAPCFAVAAVPVAVVAVDEAGGTGSDR